MAVKPFVRTATLQQSQPIVDKDGRPAAWFVRLINDNNGNVTEAINQIAKLPAIQAALESLDTATQAAQAAAEAAQNAADAASQQTDAQKREAALVNSYINPSSVLTASPTLIMIAAHTRQYADGTNANVGAGTVSATASGDVDYVFYSDPDRIGGTVNYEVSTTQPIQTGDRHVVGAVTVPTNGMADGGDGPSPPGRVYPAKFGYDDGTS